jgi:HEAT repeat protein
MKPRFFFVGVLCLLTYVAPIVAADSQDETRVKDLVRTLDSGDAKAQKKAIEELAYRLGTKAKPAIPGLTRLLQSQDKELRVFSAMALTRLAPETKGLETVLRDALTENNVQLRGRAVGGLALLGARDPMTVAPLIKTLEDENCDVAMFAAAALTRMGKPAVAPLVKALDSPEDIVRQLAAGALGRIGEPAQEAESALVRLLEDKEGRVQNAAAEALGGFKCRQKETIPALMKAMLGHGGNYISTSAAISLGKLGVGADTAPMLLDSFRDEHSTSGHVAVWAFEAMGSHAVPVLVKAMKDPSPGVRSGVFASLGKIGTPAVPELVRLLQSDQIDLQRNAAWALASLRRSDSAATAALVNSMDSSDDELREAALFALGQTRAATAVSAIRNALHDKNERVRFEAAMTLQALGVGSEPRLPQQVGEVGRFIGHTATVTRVAFLPDGRRVISAEGDGSNLRLWNIATAKQLHSINIDHARQALALSTDGQWVACGGMYQRLRLINFGTGDERRHFKDQGDLVLLAIRPKGSQIVSVDMPSIVPPCFLHIWDVASGKETRSFQLPLSNVTRLAFSDNGRRLFGEGTSTDNAARGPISRIWDVDTDKVVFEQALSKSGIDAAVFSSDGKIVLIADSTRKDGLALWDVDAGKELHRAANRSMVYSMALSPDCRRALVGRGDGTIDVYDLHQSRIVTTFQTHGGDVRSLAFSPDGRYALSGGSDRLVRLWRLPD